MSPFNIHAVFCRLSYSWLAAVLATATLCTACGDPVLEQGKLVYEKNCKVCHAQGINGAPVAGNRRMWESRKNQDLATLTQHATQGYGLMPAKGGHSELSDAQVESAVRYLLSELD